VLVRPPHQQQSASKKKKKGPQFILIDINHPPHQQFLDPSLHVPPLLFFRPPHRPYPRYGAASSTSSFYGVYYSRYTTRRHTTHVLFINIQINRFIGLIREKLVILSGLSTAFFRRGNRVATISDWLAGRHTGLLANCRSSATRYLHLKNAVDNPLKT
jgi:hypothetical protein